MNVMCNIIIKGLYYKITIIIMIALGAHIGSSGRGLSARKPEKLCIKKHLILTVASKPVSSA